MILERLAVLCYWYRRRVVILWLLVVLCIVGSSQALGGHFSDPSGIPGTQSQRAFETLESHFPTAAGDEADVVFKAGHGVWDPAIREAMVPVLAHLRSLPHVANIQSPYDPNGARLVAANGRTAYAEVLFDGRSGDVPKAAVLAVVDTARQARAPGLQVEVGGGIVSNAEAAGPGSSEALGMAAAMVILLISFGSLLAMGLPIVTALFGLGAGLGLLALMTHVLGAPTFAPEMAAMIGAGVGIDYALFVVTRYREGLQRGLEPGGAVLHAVGTAGRAVVLAGMTVVVSLLGMFLIGIAFMRGLAVGTIAAVLMVMLASITLLPALLGFIGTKIDRLRIPALHHTGGQHRGGWYLWARFIQRRPAIAAAAAGTVLVLLALPMLSMRLGFTDTGNDPMTTTSRRAYDLISAGFGPGFNGPIVVAATLPDPGGLATLTTRLAPDLERDRGIAALSPVIPNSAADTAIVRITPTTSPQDARTTELIHRIRADVARDLRGTGIVANVGGEAAAGVDFAALIADRLPLLITAVVGLSFLLLMTVFRSVAVALKAAVMNMLSIAAAYGVVVAIFQWGWLGGVVGIGKTGPIEPWVPLMLFTILFGLSMDYEVFLLSRIREEWVRSGDNAEAVADGLGATARVITAAAAIMVVVFGSFVLGDVRVLKLFGLGLAAAVLIDATVVRTVLVPATMELLGRANWWLPGWLDRALPRLSIEPPSAQPVDGDDQQDLVALAAIGGEQQ